MALDTAVARNLQRIPRVVIVTFVAALAARLAFRLEVRGDPFFHVLVTDARSYFEMGERFARGDSLFGKEPLWFAPFYPVFLGVLFRLFGPAPEIVRVLQHLAGAASAALTADVARRLSPGAGWIAGVLVALSPVAIFAETQLLFTSWAVLFTAWFLRRFAATAEAGSARAAAEAGAILGALGWIRTNALLFLPVGSLMLRRRPGARIAAVFLAGGLVTLVPVLLRNGLVAGAWTPLTVNGGFLFAEGFGEGAKGGRTLARAPEDFGPHGAYHRDAERRAGRSLSLAEASALQRSWTLESIRRDPAAAARVILRKIDLLANVREIDDNLGIDAVEDHARTLRALPGPWAWVVVPGVVGGAIALRRGPFRARALAAFALVYAASLLPFFVTSRYRLPLLVPLAGLAGFGVAETVRAAREGRRRFVGASAGGALAVSLVVLAHDPGLRASESTRLVALGAAFQEAGRSAEALALTERALARGERSAAAYQNRAVSLLALGRFEEALRSVDEALAREADSPTAWNTRGAILGRIGRFAEARDAFRRSLALDPTDAAARENLEAAERSLAAGAASP